MKTEGNIAYIDGQNLHIGTAKSDPRWNVDLGRFRTYFAYLDDKDIKRKIEFKKK